MEIQKQYNVIISNKARDGLGKIISYIALNSVTAVGNVKAEIIKSIKSLTVFPEAYPFLEGEFIPYNKYRKMIVLKRYLIIYQIQDSNVFVDYVVDCRQDYQWLIR